ncbi:hypothetical protein CNYM01_12724 [Colletotrichum nymphaeae SA-01]|uniref:Uncharacterized protein n=1 Tax=Colletotrichum nymphaeae SA-01 TaxID=1460502 RepID=A0A135S7B9_9PEZI|nr:hypothetical protein CNYM01_12724 [Colletotrichum nymphaeae SA-01]
MIPTSPPLLLPSRPSLVQSFITFTFRRITNPSHNLFTISTLDRITPHRKTLPPHDLLTAPSFRRIITTSCFYRIATSPQPLGIPSHHNQKIGFGRKRWPSIASPSVPSPSVLSTFRLVTLRPHHDSTASPIHRHGVTRSITAHHGRLNHPQYKYQPTTRLQESGHSFFLGAYLFLPTFDASAIAPRAFYRNYDTPTATVLHRANMPGKAWSKEEERVFWRSIVPISAKGIGGGSARSWEDLAVIMQREMGPNAKRQYTQLSLVEHYFQNHDKEHFSPFAAPYVREMKSAMAALKKSQLQGEASVPSQDAQAQDSFDKHTGETTDEENETSFSEGTDHNDGDYVDDGGDEDGEGDDDDVVDVDNDLRAFARDQQIETAARAVNRAAGRRPTFSAPVADMSPGLVPQRNMSKERSTLPPRPPKAVTRNRDFRAHPYDSPRLSQRGRQPPQERARMATPLETHGYYDQGPRTQAYYGQQPSRQPFYDQGPRMQDHYGQESGGHGYYDQGPRAQAYDQNSGNQGFDNGPNSETYWDQSAKNRDYYEREYAAQSQQYINQCHGRSEDNQGHQGQTSSSRGYDQSRSVEGPSQNHENRGYDQNQGTQGYHDQNRSIEGYQNHENRGYGQNQATQGYRDQNRNFHNHENRGYEQNHSTPGYHNQNRSVQSSDQYRGYDQNHANQSYDQSRNQHAPGDQGYHVNAAYNTGQHQSAPSTSYGPQPVMGSHQYGQDPQYPQSQQSSMGYSGYPVGNRPSTTRVEPHVMPRYSDHQVSMSSGRSSVAMTPNYNSPAQHSAAPSPGYVGYPSAIPDYIQRPSTASSGHQQLSRRPSAHQQVSEDHHRQGAQSNNREEPQNEQLQQSSSSAPVRQPANEDQHRHGGYQEKETFQAPSFSSTTRQHATEDYSHQGAYMDRHEEPQNEQIQRPCASSASLPQNPAEYAPQSGYMHDRGQIEDDRFPRPYVSPYPPRQHLTEHSNDQGGGQRSAHMPQYEPEMFQAFEAASFQRKE